MKYSDKILSLLLLLNLLFFFFFKQKTAYEIYQCDWSSDVCSSDLSERLAATPEERTPRVRLRGFALRGFCFEGRAAAHVRCLVICRLVAQSTRSTRIV